MGCREEGNWVTNCFTRWTVDDLCFTRVAYGENHVTSGRGGVKSNGFNMYNKMYINFTVKRYF